jgi:hypothetical protein
MKIPQPISKSLSKHTTLVKKECGRYHLDNQTASVVCAANSACYTAVTGAIAACGLTFVVASMTSMLHPAIGAIASNAPGRACIAAVLAAKSVC